MECETIVPMHYLDVSLAFPQKQLKMENTVESAYKEPAYKEVPVIRN